MGHAAALVSARGHSRRGSCDAGFVTPVESRKLAAKAKMARRDMGRNLGILVLVALLAACGGLRQPTPERQQLKSACVAGDMAACSEIGHAARRDLDAAG